MSESLIKRRDRPLGRAALDAVLSGMRLHLDGPPPSRTSNVKTFEKPRVCLEAQTSLYQPACCSMAPTMQSGAIVSPLKQYWPRHFTSGIEQSRSPRTRQCVILLLMAVMTAYNFCACLDDLSGRVQLGREAHDLLIAADLTSKKGSQPRLDSCASGGCPTQVVASARNQPIGSVTTMTSSIAGPISGPKAVTAVGNSVDVARPVQQVSHVPSRELMVAAASGDGLEPLQTAASKKKKKMMKKKKKMEKKHKEWKKGKKHKKKKYESKKKKGGSMKKKKGKKEKKKWGKEMKGHKKKGNFKKKKWGHKKKMKKGHKKGKKGHKMLKDKGHKKKGFKKVYHKEEWGKKKKWHDIKREKKWNTKQKKWKKKWHQEKGKKYKGKHMKKYKKENKHGKKYKKEKKSKWKKHKGEKFKKGHKKKKEEYSKKKEGGKKKKMKKEMKKMKKKKG